MALDGDALKAVELLLNDRRSLEWLKSLGSAQSRQNLKNFLDDRADADRSDYEEIISTAEQSLSKAFVPQAAANRDGGERGGASGIVRRTAYDASLVTAPFRFIDLPDQVVPPETTSPPALDAPVDGYFTGTIDYELIAESPLLIGAPVREKRPGEIDNPAVEPLVMGKAQTHVVPGATVRGMIRAACEIVGHAKLSRGNWHHRYGLRDFDHRKYKEQSVSKVAEVRSGFLHIRKATEADKIAHIIQDGSDAGLVFELTPCAKPWAAIRIAEFARMGINAPTEKRDSKDQIWINFKLEEKYRRAGMVADGSPAFARTYTFTDVPGSKDGFAQREVAYSPNGRPGVLVFAGSFPGNGNKKVEYVFFPEAGATAIPLQADRAELFSRLHSNPSKNKPEPLENWKVLRAAAMKGGIPVFFVGDPASRGTGFFFGLTRLFKVPHLRSVEEVLVKSQPQHKPSASSTVNSDQVRSLTAYTDDFVERLFGYVIEPKDVIEPTEGESFAPSGIARKGRVAFGFATLDPSTPVRTESAVTVVQMAPRASFAPFYLRSGAAAHFEKDYSVDGVKLAGRKAYFPRFPQARPAEALKAIAKAGEVQKQQIVESSRGRSDGRDTWSHLKFLVPATAKLPVFRGQIRLHNVSPAEIGLVLFALTHGGDTDKRFRHMIGRAKPFGAGQTRVGAVRLTLEANGNDASMLKPVAAGEHFDPATGKGLLADGSVSAAPFIEAFIAHVQKTVKAFPAVPAVEEWLGMADPELGEKAGAALAYQPLKSFQEVRKMFVPLPGQSKPPEQKERLLPAPRAPYKR